MRCSNTFGRLLIVVVLTAITTTSASADWTQKWNKFWGRVGVGYQRNTAWPDPFNEVDAMSVITPFEAQKANGWRLHNTIGAEQFRPSDGALMPSGHQKLAWIATVAPVHRRQVYILRGLSESETQSRIASVRHALSLINSNGPEPVILTTDTAPPTSSGDWATRINRSWLAELPSPKLRGTSASGTAAATN